MLRTDTRARRGSRRHGRPTDGVGPAPALASGTMTPDGLGACVRHGGSSEMSRPGIRRSSHIERHELSPRPTPHPGVPLGNGDAPCENHVHERNCPDQEEPVVALCGKRWIPNRDPDRYPVCLACKEPKARLSAVTADRPYSIGPLLRRASTPGGRLLGSIQDAAARRSCWSFLPASSTDR